MELPSLIPNTITAVRLAQEFLKRNLNFEGKSSDFKIGKIYSTNEPNLQSIDGVLLRDLKGDLNGGSIWACYNVVMCFGEQDRLLVMKEKLGDKFYVEKRSAMSGSYTGVIQSIFHSGKY